MEMKTIIAMYRRGFLFLVLSQLARDIWHIWYTLRKYKKRMHDLGEATEGKQINTAAQLDNRQCVVTRQNFEKSLEAVSRSWTTKDSNMPLYEMDSLNYVCVCACVRVLYSACVCVYIYSCVCVCVCDTVCA